MLQLRVLSLLLAATLACAGGAMAAEPEVTVAIEGHRFVPDRVVVPAGHKIRLVVENRDSTPEEFESYSLNREKIVPGHGKVAIYVGPLKPGEYEFFGEFHPDTARGTIVVQP